MSQQHSIQSSNQEGRILLALTAYHQRQFQSLRRVAQVYNVPHATLTRRYHGIMSRSNSRPIQHKLSTTEEQTIVRYILDLDSRGFAPRLCEVADMADKLLGIRGGQPVGKK